MQNNKERLIFSLVVFVSVLATEIGIFNLQWIIKTSQNFFNPSQAQQEQQLGER
jgi:hypothetical protein